MTALTRLAMPTGVAIAALAAITSTAVAAGPPGPAALVQAMPSETALSRAAGTAMAYGAPYFASTPLYGVDGIPGSEGVTRSTESYARSFAAGGVETVSVFIAEHAGTASARARVFARLRSDKGTDVTDPGIGSLSRTYTVSATTAVTRAAVGTASIGAWVTGPTASTATLRRVSQSLTRLVAQRTPGALSADAPTVPAYLERLVPPVPPTWQGDGALARGVSTAAVQAAPGYKALRTKGWGTFQYVMGLAGSAGITQAVVSASHEMPMAASRLSLASIGVPFGSPDAAAAYVAVLPKAVAKPVPVPMTVPGAAAAMAVRLGSSLGVVARVASPRGDAIEVWCLTQSSDTMKPAGVRRCTEVLTGQAQAWLQMAPR